MPAVIVEGLRKQYGSVRAVDGVSFTVESGEVFALLGPNGAGKTTALEILEGHRERDGGTVSVLGFDPATGGRAYRERIGIVLQEAGFEEEFSVSETVRLYAGFYPRRRGADEVIEQVGLTDKRDARVRTLSGGQRRRLDLALGLVGCPELLFLDEPTTGFDPRARHRAWESIAGLRLLGTTILLTTHYMEEAQHLADRVAVLREGRLVAVGSPGTIGGARARGSVLAFRLPPDAAVADLPTLTGEIHADGPAVTVRTSRPEQDMHTLTGWALDRGAELTSLTLSRPTLEEVYLELTGEEGACGGAGDAAPPRPGRQVRS
ncbi:ABC transporter ATP-binding protein [Sphaerisporangium sp. TRM90804]|uniref:ABC transporter ATP-binding protein n=1 Tax=Sphaerisporangium sp. TRM90804 TaxID=3031113 RepID=UPI00244B85E2|nr:ABC transporter ATP-binding protein [Sphaerisporangium sp. TRM90804]MDH2426215.1 ABC transporter ATP-binding protein [Sphaerisporangium sp. TRM90804]